MRRVEAKQTQNYPEPRSESTLRNTSLKFDDFISLVKTIKSIPENNLTELLTVLLITSDENIKKTFFKEKESYKLTEPFPEDLKSLFIDISNKYVCFVLSNTVVRNFNTTIIDVGSSLTDQWFKDNSIKVGNYLLTHYLKQPSLFGPYFESSYLSIEEIASTLCDDKFITSFMEETNVSGSSFPANVLMFIVKQIDEKQQLFNGKSFFQGIIQAWLNNSSSKDLIKQFDSYPIVDVIKHSFARGQNAYNELQSDIMAACSQESFRNEDHCDVVDITSSGAPIVKRYTRTIKTYGENVVQWIDSPSGPKKYHLRSDKQPSNIESFDHSDDPGCIVEGTHILMKDGSHKNVENIVEGDQVLSGNQRISVCSDELVVNEGLTHIYGINDDDPFMSFEHAVMTQRGWCSLSPHVSMSLNPHVKVTILMVGDIVWKVCRVFPEIEYEKVVVKKINIKALDGDQVKRKGYELHFREGYNVYHANNYCTLLGYPEITIQNMCINMLTNMSITERDIFHRKLDDISPFLEKVLGKGIPALVQQTLKNPESAVSRTIYGSSTFIGRRNLKNDYSSASSTTYSTHLIGDNRRYHRSELHARINPKMTVKFTSNLAMEERATYLNDDQFEVMSFKNDFLFINNKLVELTYRKKNCIYWKRPRDEGRACEEFGVVKLLSSGLLGKGTVKYGNQRYNFNASSQIDYNMTLNKVAVDWIFQMGMEEDEAGALRPKGKIVNMYGDDKEGVQRSYFSQVKDPHSHYVLSCNIDFDPDFCDYFSFEWIAIEINFTENYTGFSGVIYKYDRTQPMYRGEKFELSGTYTSIKDIHYMQNMITKYLHDKPIDTKLLSVTTQEQYFLSHETQNLLALEEEIPKSVNELFDMPAPNLDEIHLATFNTLKQLMLLVIDESTLKYFGQTRPTTDELDLNPETIERLKQNEDVVEFLKNKFVNGYLTQGLMHSDRHEIQDKFKRVGDLAEKMSYFWTGRGSTGISNDRGYNIATTLIMDAVYARHVPNFDRYMSDNPEFWAKTLYEYCMSPPIFNGLAIQNTVDNQKRLTHLTTILHALDPVERLESVSMSDKNKKRSYATALYENIINFRISDILRYYTTPDGTIDLVDFLKTYFKQYIQTIKTSTELDSIRQAALEDLQKLEEAAKSNDIDIVIQNVGYIFSDLAECVVQLKNVNIANRFLEWANRDYPIIGNLKGKFIKASALLCNFGYLAMYSFAIYGISGRLKEWKNLSPVEKTVYIGSAVTVGINILATGTSKLSNYLIAKNFASDESFVAFKSAQNLIKEMTPALNPGLSCIEADIISCTEAESITEVTSAYVSRLQKLTNIGEVAAKGAGIVLLGFCCVMNGLQIKNDFLTNQPVPVKVFDILELTANGILFLSEATIFMGGALCPPALPIIAVAAAVAGLVFTIVSIFLKRNPPPSPIEQLVDKLITEFVNKLDKPDEIWEKNKTSKSIGLFMNKEVKSNRVAASLYFTPQLLDFSSSSERRGLILVSNNKDDIKEDVTKIVKEYLEMVDKRFFSFAHNEPQHKQALCRSLLHSAENDNLEKFCNCLEHTIRVLEQGAHYHTSLLRLKTIYEKYHNETQKHDENDGDEVMDVVDRKQKTGKQRLLTS